MRILNGKYKVELRTENDIYLEKKISWMTLANVRFWGICDITISAAMRIKPPSPNPAHPVAERGPSFG